MRGAFIYALGGLLLSGCASIKVQQLTPDGLKPYGEPGLIYYMPRPYLLVTEVPYVAAAGAPSSGQAKQPVDVAPPPGTGGSADPKPAPNANAGAAKPEQHPAGGAKNQGKPAADPAKPKSGANDQGTAVPDKGAGDSPSASPATAASAGTDASYQHVFNEYQVKLVYLPDMSRPMAVTVSAGFGTVSMQPTLVDGWMLTSLQGSADSKTAEILSSVAALVTAQLGPATAAAGVASKVADGKAGGAAPKKSPLLGPGLYALEYDKAGRLTEVCAVTLFNGSVLGDPANGGIGRCKR